MTMRSLTTIAAILLVLAGCGDVPDDLFTNEPAAVQVPTAPGCSGTGGHADVSTWTNANTTTTTTAQGGTGGAPNVDPGTGGTGGAGGTVGSPNDDPCDVTNDPNSPVMSFCKQWPDTVAAYICGDHIGVCHYGITVTSYETGAQPQPVWCCPVVQPTK